MVSDTDYRITVIQKSTDTISIQLERTDDASLWQETFSSSRECLCLCLVCDRLSYADIRHANPGKHSTGNDTSLVPDHWYTFSFYPKHEHSLSHAELEELSARAGSFKTFSTFTRMLNTALQGCSATVSLDVLTIAGQMLLDGRQHACIYIASPTCLL